MFKYLEAFYRPYESFSQWPDIDDLETQFKQRLPGIRPVAQAPKPKTFEEHYEPRIYLKGELQTRSQNWHDFFNAMVWLAFPQTKQALNKLHYQSARRRPPGSNRSPLENSITLFDECGIIILSDRDDLLELIRGHAWTELFIRQRSAFDEHIRCIVFGHAIYEKALAPYVGMTCQALLLESGELLDQVRNNNLVELDQEVASSWLEGNISNTRDLHPFPVLGVPGWYQANENATFYSNTHYFRPLKSGNQNK